MAGRISELAALATPDAADQIEVLDVSDLSMAATGTNKRTPISALGGGGTSAVPWDTPSPAAVGGPATVHGLFPGQVHVGGGANVALVAGTMYAAPMVLPFDITISSIGTHVATLAGGSLVRVGFVGADESWIPKTTGVINACTFDTASGLYGKAVYSLTVTLAAGRWFRIWRAEGGAPELYGPRAASVAPSLTAMHVMSWTAPASPWPLASTGSGAFVDPIAAFNLYSATGSYSGGALNTAGIIDPFLATWT